MGSLIEFFNEHCIKLMLMPGEELHTRTARKCAYNGFDITEECFKVFDLLCLSSQSENIAAASFA